MLSRKRAIVIGAGIGGLTAAALLGSRGYDIKVLEKSDRPGGRAAQAAWQGHTFDLGPTLLFMLDVYRAAFSAWGADFDREVPTIRLRPNYRLNFPNGDILTVSSVLSETMRSLEEISPGSSRGLLPYLAGAAKSFELSLEHFIGRPVKKATQFLAPRVVRALIDAGAFRSLGKAAARAFANPGLANAFSFQSMYLGMSPFQSPDLYRLLVFAELGQGIYYPRGGIGALCRALERAAVANGASVQYNTDVTSIDLGADRAWGVRVGQEFYSADVVVVNADLAYAYAHLLCERRHRSGRMRSTPSALLIYAALTERYPDLAHHEFLMPQDLKSTCDDIFHLGVVPRDPAVYLAAPSASDPSVAPAGGESLYVLVPVPNLRKFSGWHRTEEIVERILSTVERRRLPGLRSRLRFYKTRTPLEFERNLHLHDGAAFGLSHDVFQIGPLRPDNRHRRYRNVYFVGASTRPATGLPMVTLGAMQTAERILEEHPVHA